MSLWENYVKATSQRKPNSYIDSAIELLGNRRGEALDIGSGAGVDAKYLAEKGFTVTAFDNDETAIAFAKYLTEGLSVRVELKDITAVELPKNYYDLIICSYVLLFLEKVDALGMLNQIQKALTPGGVFIFATVGNDDEWKRTGQAKTFFSAEEFKAALSDLEMLVFIEKKEQGKTATGQEKFWHRIQGFARKR